MSDTTQRAPGEVARLWFEEMWNERKAELIDELMSPDSVGMLEGGQEIVGPNGFKAFQQVFLDALPDVKIEIKDLLADDTKACVHWEARGRHLGDSLGFPATQKPVVFHGTTWMEVRDGQIVGGCDCWNQGGLMAYLMGAAGGMEQGQGYEHGVEVEAEAPAEVELGAEAPLGA